MLTFVTNSCELERLLVVLGVGFIVYNFLYEEGRKLHHFSSYL